MKKDRKVMVSMILLVGVGAVVLMSASVWAKKGDGNATGTVTASSSLMDVIVKGNVDGGYLWLGFTLIYSNGYEDDKAVVEVKGNFKESYTVSPTRAASGSVDYVASLWRWKIDKSECKADGCILCREKKMHKEHVYQPCKYCQKNGYHMEDRVDSVSGTWNQ